MNQECDVMYDSAVDQWTIAKNGYKYRITGESCHLEATHKILIWEDEDCEVQDSESNCCATHASVWLENDPTVTCESNTYVIDEVPV